MKFLNHAAIAMLLFGAATPAVVAEPMTKTVMSSPGEMSADSRPDWEVTSVEDGKLMVRMADGDMEQSFMIQPETVSALNLQPGSMIELNYDNLMVGEIVSATQTNIEVEVADQKRMTYIIPESGNDYDLSDQLAVTPDRILGKVSEWELTEADITVIAPAQSASSNVEVSTESSAMGTEVETDTQYETEAQYDSEPVQGMW